MTIGPYLSVPIGLAVFTVIITAVIILVGEIAWKVMDHLPEDDMPYSAENHFVIDE